MTENKIDLYEYFGLPRAKGAEGYLKTYILNDYDYCPGRLRPAMLIMAGGGYAYRSSREEEPIVMAYLAQGYNCFVIDYSVKNFPFPTPLIEACMAVSYVRENAASLRVLPDKIAAIGFSAGGHLCGMLGTLFGRKEVKEALKDKAALCRPDAVILAYPVLKIIENTHAPSAEIISAGDTEIKKIIDIPSAVNSSSSPAFIWATANDAAVPSESSLETAAAYKKAGVPFELHVYENGIHGLSLSTKETDVTKDDQSPWQNQAVATWLPLSLTWLKNRGFKIY